MRIASVQQTDPEGAMEMSVKGDWNVWGRRLEILEPMVGT